MIIRKFARRTLMYLPFIGIAPLLLLGFCAEGGEEVLFECDNIILTNDSDASITAVSFYLRSNAEENELANYLQYYLERSSIEINPHDSDTIKIQLAYDTPNEGISVYVAVISSKTMERFPIDEIIDNFMVDSCYEIPESDVRLKKHYLVYSEQ